MAWRVLVFALVQPNSDPATGMLDLRDDNATKRVRIPSLRVLLLQLTNSVPDECLGSFYKEVQR